MAHPNWSVTHDIGGLTRHKGIKSPPMWFSTSVPHVRLFVVGFNPTVESQKDTKMAKRGE